MTRNRALSVDLGHLSVCLRDVLGIVPSETTAAPRRSRLIPPPAWRRQPREPLTALMTSRRSIPERRDESSPSP
jgi:hypothetical protein